jgi:hypothetical protein
MGCSVSRENIESEILILQLRKMKIKDEREAMIKLYEDITGEKYIRKKVPDYIDHKAMKEIKKLRKDTKIKKEGSSSTKSSSKKLSNP